jgi:D-alanyl-D-alanine carboxypeptidase/Putative peptidoglycan binding domain
MDIDFATIDPAADERFPRITDGPPVEVDWPAGWGREFTERDAVAAHLARLDEIGVLATPKVRTAVPSLVDYRLPSLKGWGTGWPTCGGVGSFGTAVVTANRSGARFSVNKRIAILFDLLIDRMEARGYLCKPDQCGAFNCRPVAGTSVSSLHAWALAGDLNWADNPYTSTGRFAMPLWVPREVFNPHGFAWGGDYTGSKKDYMHIEFMGTPEQADEMTHKALGAAPVAPTPPGVRVLELANPFLTGDDVRAVQRILRAWYGLPAGWVDGIYGPGTVEYVKRAQRGTPPQPALAADGVVGPATRRKLGL